MAVTQVVAAAAERARLGIIYARRLRHSAATANLAEGGSLAEIGQVLRPQDEAVDEASMRSWGDAGPAGLSRQFAVPAVTTWPPLRAVPLLSAASLLAGGTIVLVGGS